MKENLNEYQEAYHVDFQFYDENQWYLAHYAKKLCASIRENKYSSVLSLGIGHQVVSEHILNELNNTLTSYTILEGSEDIINAFKYDEKYKDKISLIHTYFEDFTSDKKYDIIEMGFILEHVDSPELILNKFKSFLNPGGTLFVAVPNARSLHRLIGYEAKMLDNMYKLSPADHQLGHKRYFDLDMLTKMVLDAGYKIKATTGLMLKPVTGSQIKQLGWDKQVIDALFIIGEKYPEIANCMLIEAGI